jgi:hypothetical protein
MAPDDNPAWLTHAPSVRVRVTVLVSELKTPAAIVAENVYVMVLPLSASVLIPVTKSAATAVRVTFPKLVPPVGATNATWRVVFSGMAALRTPVTGWLPATALFTMSAAGFPLAVRASIAVTWKVTVCVAAFPTSTNPHASKTRPGKQTNANLFIFPHHLSQLRMLKIATAFQPADYQAAAGKILAGDMPIVVRGSGATRWSEERRSWISSPAFGIDANVDVHDDLRFG